jgi:hypothetical protein
MAAVFKLISERAPYRKVGSVKLTKVFPSPSSTGTALPLTPLVVSISICRKKAKSMKTH